MTTSENHVALINSIDELRDLVTEDHIFSRWRFDKKLDEVAAKLCAYVEDAAVSKGQIGCAILYRTRPAHCYVGGSSTDRRKMEFDATYYSLPEDWLDSATAFSMFQCVDFVLNDADAKWWNLTKLGLEHHKKDSEKRAAETRSFVCFAVPEQRADKMPPSQRRVLKNDSHLSQLLEDRILLKTLFLKDRRDRKALRNEYGLLKDLNAKINNGQTGKELSETIAKNSQLHAEIEDDTECQHLLKFDRDICSRIAALGDLPFENEFLYYSLKPANRLASIENSTKDPKQQSNIEASLRSDGLTAVLTAEQSARHSDAINELVGCEKRLRHELQDSDEFVRQRFLDFKKSDLRHKSIALKALRAMRTGDDHTSAAVAAIRLSSNNPDDAERIQQVLFQSVVLRDLEDLLRAGRLRLAGDNGEDLTLLALGTFADLFTAVPTLGQGEYHALDRLSSFLQALFGVCEVSIFEGNSKSYKDKDNVELWLAATTALSDKPESQHFKFRKTFRQKSYRCRYNSVSRRAASRENGLPKTVRAYLLAPRVIHEERDTESREFRTLGEISSGDTRSFIAFGIPAKQSGGLPYGVIRVVSGKREHFSTVQRRLARAVAEGLAVIWDFFPKNESLKVDGNIPTESIRIFLGEDAFDKDEARFCREIAWLYTKVFHANDVLRIVEVLSQSLGRMTVEVKFGDHGRGYLSIEAKKADNRYTAIKQSTKLTWRETRTLQAALKVVQTDTLLPSTSEPK